MCQLLRAQVQHVKKVILVYVQQQQLTGCARVRAVLHFVQIVLNVLELSGS